MTDNKTGKIVFFTIILSIILLSSAKAGFAAENQSFRPYQLAWELEKDFSSIDISPIGDFIVVSENREMQILDGDTGKIIHSVQIGYVNYVSTNGEYIIVNGQASSDGIKILDKELNEIWSYFDDEKYNYLISPEGVYISPSGRNMISSYRKIINGKYNGIILYYFEDNKLLWKKDFENLTENVEVSIISDGESINVNAIPQTFETWGYSVILDRNGNLITEINGYNKLKLSSDGKFAIGLRLENRTSNRPPKIICFEINTNNIIWEYKPSSLSSPYLIDRSHDINYTIYTSGTLFFVLDKYGKLVQKYDLNKRIRDIRISSDGSHLLVKTDNKIYVFSNNKDQEIIPYLIYPNQGQVFLEKNITLKWDYQEKANKYLIDISGTIFESQTKEFSIPSYFLGSGSYKWSVKAIKQNGVESNWSKIGTFSISDSLIWFNQIKSIFSEFDPKIAYIGGILVIGVMAIFIRPYYKRLKVKREMARTPTDWCPNCLKFTSGAAICPHCGKATLTENFTDKIKKKQKRK